MKLDTYSLRMARDIYRADWHLDNTATASEIRTANAEDDAVLDALARLESGASVREVVGTMVLVPHGGRP